VAEVAMSETYRHIVVVRLLFLHKEYPVPVFAIM